MSNQQFYTLPTALRSKIIRGNSRDAKRIKEMLNLGKPMDEITEAAKKYFPEYFRASDPPPAPAMAAKAKEVRTDTLIGGIGTPHRAEAQVHMVVAEPPVPQDTVPQEVRAVVDDLFIPEAPAPTVNEPVVLSAEENRALLAKNPGALRETAEVKRTGKPKNPQGIVPPDLECLTDLLKMNGSGPYLDPKDIPKALDLIGKQREADGLDQRSCWVPLYALRRLINLNFIREGTAEGLMETWVKFADGERVRRARYGRDLQAERVTDLLGELGVKYTKHSLINVENGSAKLYGERLEALAVVLDVPVECLTKNGPPLPELKPFGPTGAPESFTPEPSFTEPEPVEPKPAGDGSAINALQHTLGETGFNVSEALQAAVAGPAAQEAASPAPEGDQVQVAFQTLLNTFEGDATGDLLKLVQRVAALEQKQYAEAAKDEKISELERKMRGRDALIESLRQQVEDLQNRLMEGG